ncbi:MAG: peptidoglycan DD-metalloendopeptidase family protein [Micavibrio sp.]|nr:peptidoglycan DD-metalloendopeptidase family protein [Micavibrio sp.]
MLKNFVIGTMTAAALSLAALPADARNIDGRNIKAELAAKQVEQQKLQQQSKEIGGQVDDLKAKLITSVKDARDLENGLADGDKKLKSLRSQRQEDLEKLYSQNNALGGLVTAAQKYQRTSTPQMLLMATPIDAARASLIMKSMIPEISRQSDALKVQLAEMNKLESDINDQIVKQSQQRQQLGKQQGDLAVLLKERQTLYQKTEDSRKQQEAELAKLAKEAKNLEDLVTRIQPRTAHVTRTAGYASLPANIVPPVSGTVKTAFGETDDLGGKSEGITFSARPGSAVVTPLAGTVKFAGPFQKYKQILIVEHAGGYHSLIAGLGRIDTVVGATLAAGEPVGIAETSQTDPRIYYELRQNGEPVNPRQLVAAQRKQDKS